MHLCITQHCPSRHRGPARTLLRYSNTTDGMLLGLHNSAVCVSFPREREFYRHCGFIPRSRNFFFVSLGLLSLNTTLVLIPSCKHVTDVQDRNRMVQEVFEKDRGRFALSKCKFFEKRSISEKVMGKFLSGSANQSLCNKGLQLFQLQFHRY